MMNIIMILTASLVVLVDHATAADVATFSKGENAAATSKAALVFLVAGQSNAGGVAAFSPETNERAGMQEKHPTIPGTTAKEVGIPTTADAYPRSYIWGRGFEQLTPGKNLKTCYRFAERIQTPICLNLTSAPTRRTLKPGRRRIRTAT